MENLVKIVGFYVNEVKHKGTNMKGYAKEVKAFVLAIETLTANHISILNAIANRCGTAEFRESLITKTQINLWVAVMEASFIGMT